jgi:NAD-dependent deacetylase
MLGDVELELARARALVDGADRIVVLTGAGISTASGIPDFRGPEGLWTKDPGAEMLSSFDRYVADPEVRRRAWQSRLRSPAWGAEPNEGHRRLVDLERRGILDRLITQNIDGLHQLAGSDPDLVIEIHGNVRETVCLACGRRRPMAEALVRLHDGELDPDCDGPGSGGRCGGILKSATVSFGQPLVAEDLAAADAAARHCNLMVAIGSTLSVYPAAGVVPQARQAGAGVIIINGEPTAMDELADVVLRGDITEVLCGLVDTSG